MTELAIRAQQRDNLPAPELSGARDWRPGYRADNRRHGGFFMSAHWLCSYGRAGGETREGLPALYRYANLIGPAHPIGVGWRYFNRVQGAPTMGSKPVFARAGLAAPVRSSVTRAGITPRTWHPVVYLERGPVRFAGRPTIAEAMDEARSLAESLGARTWSALPGRWSVAAETSPVGGAK